MILLRMSSTYLQGRNTDFYSPVIKIHAGACLQSKKDDIVQEIQALMTSTPGMKQADMEIFCSRVDDFATRPLHQQKLILTAAANLAAYTRLQFLQTFWSQACSDVDAHDDDSIEDLLRRRDELLLCKPQLLADLRKMREHMMLLAYSSFCSTVRERHAVMLGELMLLSKHTSASLGQQTEQTSLGSYKLECPAFSMHNDVLHIMCASSLKGKKMQLKEEIVFLSRQ